MIHPNKIIFTIILFLIIFNTSAGFCIPKNITIINKVFDETSFKLDDFYSLKHLDKINAFFPPWSGEASGIYIFKDKVAEKRIRSNKSAYIGLFFKNNLLKMSIHITKFKTHDDSLLGFADKLGYKPYYKYTQLFSKPILNTNEPIEGEKFLISNEDATFEFIRNNFVCSMGFNKSKGGFTSEDYNLIDDVINMVILSIENNRGQ